MSQSPNFEWQFFDDTRHDDAAWQQVCEPSNGELNPTMSNRWAIKRLWKEVLLVLITTVILLGQFPWSAIFAAHKPEKTAVHQIITLETDFFRFHHQRQDTRAVQAVAANVDRRYLRLRRQFDLAAPASVHKLTINVGNPDNRTGGVSLDLAACTSKGEMLLLCQKRLIARTDEDELTVSLLMIGANDSAGPAARLAGTVQDWLTSRLFDETVQRSVIQPLWQPMVGGLRHYLWLKQNDKQVKLDYPALWKVVHTLPLNAAFPDDLRYRAATYQWASAEFKVALDADRLSLVITGSLADYLVTTYGRERLARLLIGFSRYDSWEKLSPAVFGISARQLENDWQHYLQNLPPDSPFFAAVNTTSAVEQTQNMRNRNN